MARCETVLPGSRKEGSHEAHHSRWLLPMKPRSPRKAQKAVHEATEAVIRSGDTVIEEFLWDACEAALDGQPREYLADIISGKIEGPYRPRGGWRAR